MAELWGRRPCTSQAGRITMPRTLDFRISCLKPGSQAKPGGGFKRPFSLTGTGPVSKIAALLVTISGRREPSNACLSNDGWSRAPWMLSAIIGNRKHLTPKTQDRPPSHPIIIRPAPALRRHPRDDLVRVGDVAGFAVHAVSGVQANCVHCKTCDIADPYQIIT